MVLHPHAHSPHHLRHLPRLGHPQGRPWPHVALDGHLGHPLSGPGHVRPLAHLWLLHLSRGGVRCPSGLCLDVLQHLLLVGRQESLQECQMVPESRY